MPYSLRTKLKHLACERDITVKECERLIKALDTVDAVEEIKAEIKHLHDWAFNREEVMKLIDEHIERSRRNEQR